MTSAAATRPEPAEAPAFAGDSAGPARVVVGVHGSDRSLAALEWAARLAASRGWDLVVITAWPEPEEVFVHEVPGHHCQPRERAAAELAAALARLDELEGPAPAVLPQLVNAPVSAALLAACDSGSVLVVGASHVEEHEDPSLRGVDEVCSLFAPGSVVVIDVDGDVPDRHRRSRRGTGNR